MLRGPRTKAERLAWRKASYGIPPEAVKDLRSSELAEVWTYQRGEKIYALGFWGSSAKASFYNRFRSYGERDAHIDEFFKRAEAWSVRQAASKAERVAAPRGLELGDVLRSTWGYEQTNVDYYEVTRLVGDKMVEIREIGQEREETQWLAGRCVPVPGKFIGEPMVRVAKNGSVKVRSFASAYKIDGKDVGGGKKVYSSTYWSAYA